MGVSRTRCGILHAAPQSWDPGFLLATGTPALSNRDPGSAAHRFAKSYALRCIRGTREAKAANRAAREDKCSTHSRRA
jgi:hypothetical protein